ncbi:Six-hairpin glycosidase [Clathrospora elynae]|uniref:Six-hairpin glycosidase n=1 Tax=Clathrospora elynae TaxID=706981 RepID=A0A6A5SQH6_9PLEO|nr:Six-hairpin glycosidase [Clathrospora elynae]
MFLSLLLIVLLSIAPIPKTYAQTDYDKVTDPIQRTNLAFSTLQTWYNASTGLWETTGWWNCANIITLLGNFAKADTKNETLQGLVRDIFANALRVAPAKNPQPGIEDPPLNGTKNGTSAHSTLTGLESGYMKHLKPSTNEPYTMFPANWDNSSGPYKHVTTLTYPTTLDPRNWLDGFYDDDLWWALAWINAYDLTLDSSYLNLAEGIFTAVAGTWGTSCFSGGIYWSWKKDYINAIANELFFGTAAHLANRFADSNKKAMYSDWAERTLAWFLQSGMINERGTINDGLTANCTNNNMTTWSYNQGVVLGGLVELNAASPNSTYLTLASRIAHAALIELSDSNGVIHDVCEPDCGGDGAQFKGIFMRNLVALHEAAPDDAYAKAIRTNADSIWVNDRNETAEELQEFSVDWAGPWVEPANASTHSSAMDALVAAIVVA